MSSSSTVARRVLVASKWNSGINIDTLTERDISRALKGLRTASNILSTSGRPRATALKLIENLERRTENVCDGVDWKECSGLESAIAPHSRKGYLNTSFTDFVDKTTGRKDTKQLHWKTCRKRELRNERLGTSATSESVAPTETGPLNHKETLVLVEQSDHREDQHERSECPGGEASEPRDKPSPDESGEIDDEISWEGCSAVGDDADEPLDTTCASRQSSELPGILSVEVEGSAVPTRGAAKNWKSGIELSKLGMTEQELASLQEDLRQASGFLRQGEGPHATASALLVNLETQPDNVSQNIEWLDFQGFKYALKYHRERSGAYDSVCAFYKRVRTHDTTKKRGQKVQGARQQRRLDVGSTYGSERGIRKRRQKGGSGSTNHPVSTAPDSSQTNMSLDLGDGSSSDGVEEVPISGTMEEYDSLLQKVKEYIGPTVKSVLVRLSENLEDIMTTGSGDLLNNIEWGQYINWRNSSKNTRSGLLKDILHELDSKVRKPTSAAPKPRSKVSRQVRSLIPPKPRPRQDDWFDSRWGQGISLEFLGLDQREVFTTTQHLDMLTREDSNGTQRRATATSLITNLLLHPENITQTIPGEDYRALLEESTVSQDSLSQFSSRVRGVLSGSCYCQSVPGLPPSPADSHIVPRLAPADTPMTDVGETPALPWGVVDATRPWDGMESTRPPGSYD